MNCQSGSARRAGGLHLPYTELTGSRRRARSIASPIRWPLVLGFVLALAVVPTADGSLTPYRSPGNEVVSLINGRGVAAFSAYGVLHGKLARGRLLVRDLPKGPSTRIKVLGAEHVKRINAQTRVYRGARISFYIARGGWRLRVRGRGIYAIGSVRGKMMLEGAAGKYAIEGSVPVRWPREATVFALGD